MAEPQTPEIPSDKIRSRPPGDAARGDNSTVYKGEQRAFADPAARAGQALPEGAALVRDLSQTAADATRAVSQRGREAARDVADNWRDFGESVLSMQLDMNRLFDDVWRQATGFGLFPTLRPARPFAGMGAGMGAASMMGLPPTDLKETKDDYRLCVELPGLALGEVGLEIAGDTLRLTGHKAEERDDHGAAYRVSERRFGRFERRFPLPSDIDRGRIEASFRDGLLRVTLPKAAGAADAGHRVEIKG